MSTLKALGLGVTPQDIFTSSATQATDLGAVASTGDARIFRYCLAGATSLVPGKLQAGSAQDTTNLNPSGGLAVAAAAIGATQITLTGSLTLAANLLAGSYMSVAVTPGQGYTYKVKGNTAVTSAANCVVTLEDPLIIALTTSSKVLFAANPYSNVIVNPATASSSPCGVAIFIVVNAQYGWVQTRGMCGVLSDGSTAVGLGLAPSASVAGAVKTMAATIPQVGWATNVRVDTEYDLAFLTLD